LIHQANKFINDRIKKKFKINSDKVPSTLKNFGNTGSASVPLLMVTELEKQLKENALTLVLTAFGAGLSWGSTCITTNKIICSDLIEI
jgi:3-oxoacyl-[acyl-carrier-protein] synthase-3